MGRWSDVVKLLQLEFNSRHQQQMQALLSAMALRGFAVTDLIGKAAELERFLQSEEGIEACQILDCLEQTVLFVDRPDFGQLLLTGDGLMYKSRHLVSRLSPQLAVIYFVQWRDDGSRLNMVALIQDIIEGHAARARQRIQL